MKTSHLIRRAPRRHTGFSWGRFPMGDTGVISYRLFRRDHTGALHLALLDFRGTDRAAMARDIRRQCHQLRDKVDEIDLQALYAREQAA